MLFLVFIILAIYFCNCSYNENFNSYLSFDGPMDSRNGLGYSDVPLANPFYAEAQFNNPRWWKPA